MTRLKALFTFILIAILAWQPAFAQTPEQVPLQFKQVRTGGVKGGVNIASVAALPQPDLFLGYYGGLFGYVQASQDLGYGAELLYSKQGVSGSNYELAMNYLSLPLVFNIYEDNFTFQGGAYGAVLLKANRREGMAKTDKTDSFRKTDLGLLIGCTYQPGAATFISVRFNLGLENINNGFTTPVTNRLRNRNFQLGAGYVFN